jgi:hypothetical protein
MNYSLRTMRDCFHILRPHVLEHEWEGCIDADPHPPAGSMKRYGIGKPYDIAVTEWISQRHCVRPE